MIAIATPLLLFLAVYCFLEPRLSIKLGAQMIMSKVTFLCLIDHKQFSTKFYFMRAINKSLVIITSL